MLDEEGDATSPIIKRSQSSHFFAQKIYIEKSSFLSFRMGLTKIVRYLGNFEF